TRRESAGLRAQSLAAAHRGQSRARLPMLSAIPGAWPATRGPAAGRDRRRPASSRSAGRRNHRTLAEFPLGRDREVTRRREDAETRRPHHSLPPCVFVSPRRRVAASLHLLASKSPAIASPPGPGAHHTDGPLPRVFGEVG